MSGSVLPGRPDCGGFRIQAIHSLESWTAKAHSQLGTHCLSHRPRALPMYPFLSVPLERAHPETRKQFCFISRARERERAPLFRGMVNSPGASFGPGYQRPSDPPSLQKCARPCPPGTPWLGKWPDPTGGTQSQPLPVSVKCWGHRNDHGLRGIQSREAAGRCRGHGMAQREMSWL